MATPHWFGRGTSIYVSTTFDGRSRSAGVSLQLWRLVVWRRKRVMDRYQKDLDRRIFPSWRASLRRLRVVCWTMWSQSAQENVRYCPMSFLQRKRQTESAAVEWCSGWGMAFAWECWWLAPVLCTFCLIRGWRFCKWVPVACPHPLCKVEVYSDWSFACCKTDHAYYVCDTRL